MSQRRNPARDKIFEQANLLRKQGVVPTTLNIRAKLGGSQTTASKYLRQWRELYDCEEDFSPKRMQKQLSEQLKINEHLGTELLHAKQQNASYGLEITMLKDRILGLETVLHEKTIAESDKINNLQEINKVVADSFTNATQMLAAQLTAINEQAIRGVQEVGQHFDENVIELRLEVRYLKEQITLKEREVKKLQQQLTDMALKSKNHV